MIQNFPFFLRSLRILSTNEIVDVLESSMGDDEGLQNIEVYLDPPCDGAISDGDSGDENCGDIERLNRHQLLAPAELILQHTQDIQECEVPDSVSTALPPAGQSSTRLSRIQSATLEVPTGPVILSTSTQPRSAGSQPPRKWIKRDLRQSVEWTVPLPRAVHTLSEASEPIDFFELFFDQELVKYIVRHSVMYAVSKDSNTGFTLSSDEIYCFIGILILSGYAPLPRRRMFWELNEDTHNVLVSKSMRRNRFEEIFRYLHVADNDNLRPGDKMAKVRPLFDMMNQKFLIYAPIEKNFSIDESMIMYFGRHGCKQHIHGKPIRFGFKAWEAATRLGYCLQADLYEGRSEARETGLGEHVVTKLTEAIKIVYPDSSFSVYCDNFFTSPSLLSNLQRKNVKITGTARQNRVDKCPLLDVKSFKKEARGFYDYRFDRKDGICAVRWNDNNVVTLLSNEFGVQPIQKAGRYSAALKRRIEIDQPNVVAQYNRFMGGVDRLDANIGTYRIAIRGKKWYTSILTWLVDVTVNNSALLARSMGANVDTLEFRRSIARTLLLKYGTDKTRPLGAHPVKVMTNVPLAVRRHAANHMIMVTQNRKRCAVCKNKTVKMCGTCCVNLHDKCFAKFHA